MSVRTCARLPTRLAAADYAQSILQPQRINLHDAAIDPEIEVPAQVVLDIVSQSNTSLNGRTVCDAVQRNPPFLESLEQLPLRAERKGRSIACDGGIAEEPSAALRIRPGRAAVRLSRGRISGFANTGSPARNALFIHSLEGVEWQVHFAANFQRDLWAALSRKPKRHVAKRPKILVTISDHPFPACRARY
jgi:hypothetical protein